MSDTNEYLGTHPKREGLVYLFYAQLGHLKLADGHWLMSAPTVQLVFRQAPRSEQSRRRKQTSILSQTRCVHQSGHPAALQARG
jgi:hypothetical protein